jgi:hypothetical protein
MALLTLLPAGCSFAFVDGPPSTHKQLPYFECTSSNVLPTVDAVVGGIYGVAAAATLIDSSSSSSSSYSNDRSDALLAGALAVVAVSSAVYGYHRTSSCREAKEQLMLRLGNGSKLGPVPAKPYDPWVDPPPSVFSAPQPAPTAPPAGGGPTTEPGPARDTENPRP